MKVLALFCLVAFASGASLVERENDVLALLYKIAEPIRDRFPQLKEASINYQPSKHPENYEDGGAAASFLDDEIYLKNVQRRKAIFSLFNGRQRGEALMIFDVLMSSKDWETFSSSAAFYRERMNEGAFVYALYTAVLHSSLGEGLIMPPLYEVTPHMFANMEVMQKAYGAKMTQTPGKFKMSFTGSKKNPEQRVAYFGEDIGMNVHHNTFHMDFPFWWEDKYGYSLDRKGEIFFWMHHQMAARFDSERLSNHLNFVEELYWNKPIKEGFAPHTTYRYGGEFPARSDNLNFEDVIGVARIRDMVILERRIRDAIADGYITDRSGKHIDIRNDGGITILADVIEASNYSPNAEYYGSLHNLAHIILGRQVDPRGKFNMPPSVMEHFETGIRDPAFFRLRRYIDNFFKELKDTLPAYTKDDVAFDGVSLESIALEGKLETFFEDFEFNLAMGVDDTEEIADVPISAIISRLNHEKFSFVYNVKNNGAERLATVRAFLCPRKDANGIIFSLEEGRWNCIEVDKFWTTLSPGANHITRKSDEVSTTSPDIPSFEYLIANSETLNYGQNSRHCGVPNRMLLPKGTTEGMEFAFFVAVTDGATDLAIPVEKVVGSHAQCGIRGEVYPDKRPLGFPLDRKIADARDIFLNWNNIKKTVVTITHRA